MRINEFLNLDQSAHSNLQSLSLDFGVFTELTFQTFCLKLEQCKVLENFEIATCYLRDMSPEMWHALFSILAHCPSLNSFVFGSNSLGSMNKSELQPLCDVLVQCKNLKRIEFGPCYLYLMDYDQWKQFCEALARSNLECMIIGDRNLCNMTDDKKSLFKPTLERMSKLQELEYDPDDLAEPKSYTLKAKYRNHVSF